MKTQTPGEDKSIISSDTTPNQSGQIGKQLIESMRSLGECASEDEMSMLITFTRSATRTFADCTLQATSELWMRE